MMLPSKPANDGFSLIELLVVISIMAGVMALVGPLTVRSVDSARAQTELVSIERWINGWGRKAFLTGSAILVESQGAALIAQRRGEAIESRALDFWHPEERLTIEFSSAGVPSVNRVELVSGNLVRSVTIRGNLPRSGAQ